MRGTLATVLMQDDSFYYLQPAWMFRCWAGCSIGRREYCSIVWWPCSCFCIAFALRRPDDRHTSAWGRYADFSCSVVNLDGLAQLA